MQGKRVLVESSIDLKILKSILNFTYIKKCSEFTVHSRNYDSKMIVRVFFHLWYLGRSRL